MDWLKKKKARAYDEKQRLVRGKERGALLLEDLIKCCDGKSNPIKFFSEDQILEATDNFGESNYVFSPSYIATALVYLHTAFPSPFVYNRLRLDNILLDEDGVAKLSDFSTCILVPQGETFVKIDRRAIIYSFRDHDYLKNGVVSEKMDVFTIGFFMQELLTGEDRFYLLCGEEGEGEGDSDSDDYDPERKVINWLSKSMEEGRMDAIADPNMIEEMGEVSYEELCRMKAFLMLSFRCVGHTGEVPTMVEVAKELKKMQRSL